MKNQAGLILISDVYNQTIEGFNEDKKTELELSTLKLQIEKSAKC